MQFLRATAGFEKGMNEGCRLVECLERGNECINHITIDEVLKACHDILAEQLRKEPSSANEPAIVSAH